MSVTRFMRGFAAFCAASILAAFAATPLNDIPGTTEMYSAAETDARIVELGGAGDYATVSNAAVNAGWRATNYTDYAVVRLSQTNSVLSGGPYQAALPYPTNAVPYSAISDAPSAVDVVAPSTNATAGAAADAKETGKALYTGFTEWEFSGLDESWTYRRCSFSEVPEVAPLGTWQFVFYISSVGSEVSLSGSGTEDSVEVAINEFQGATATRHLVTPTRTSQLVNDGDGTYPFATTNQIPPPVDISKKQDALTPAQTNAVNSGVTSAKVQTWDGYAALISAKVSTNALAGQTYDFSRNYDIIRATAAIAVALGATITNNPTAQGGN